MHEHAIQLRRAWDSEIEGTAKRVDLPIVWGVSALPSRLSRRFNRPPIDPAREVVFLRLGDTVGLHSIALNGSQLVPTQGVSGDLEVMLDELRPSRNRLDLSLDPDAIPRDVEWGRIALVIRER